MCVVYSPPPLTIATVLPVILSFPLPSPPCLSPGQDIKQLIFVKVMMVVGAGTAQANCSMVHIFTERKYVPGEVIVPLAVLLSYSSGSIVVVLW